MFGETHDLSQDLPEHEDTILNLKAANSHFAKLFEEYNEVNREILRVEQEIEARGDFALEDLKKTRILLKDQVLAMIREHETAMAT